ncbi:MAG TPA: YggS family pyridoxal phosphate-dependent enzyme [Nitrospiraceae bacterium]|nr:YggS family pyridoxal phosphate-dependent enzyme [Nitrospiraceae bacterium]
MDAEPSRSIGDNVRNVCERLHRAALGAGRRVDSVRLVAATKSVSVEAIRQGLAAGLNILGESRLQEALPKIEALRGESVHWHFIGRLQRRKVRSVVGLFDLIHSVDSLELAQEIDRRAEQSGHRQAVLLEVNIADEATKAGFRPDELIALLPELSRLSHMVVKGLMTIPPPTMDAEGARPYFRRLREMARRLGQGVPGLSMDELSMGMSNDYVVAVEEGATLVRVGTAIFGTRRD